MRPFLVLTLLALLMHTIGRAVLAPAEQMARPPHRLACFKALFLLLALLLPVAGVRSHPLIYSGGDPVYAGGTNKVVALSTNGFVTLGAGRTYDLALFCGFNYLNAPGAGDATGLRLDFFRGIDGSTFETNAWFSWTVPGNSTTAASQATNIFLGAVPYVRVRVANVSTNSHVTNLFLSVGQKR